MLKSTYHLLTCAKQREVYTAEEFKELLAEKEQDNSGTGESETHSKSATLCFSL